MSVTSVHTDYDRLTVTVIADFDAPVERVWALWADPRRLERWWGPPGYPATFEHDELVAGGEVSYFMVDADGGRYAGRWRVHRVDPPTGLEFDDLGGGLPVATVSVRLADHAGGTRMEMRSRFASRADLDRWAATDTPEGQQAAIAQMDALLRPPPPAAPTG